MVDVIWLVVAFFVGVFVGVSIIVAATKDG